MTVDITVEVAPTAPETAARRSHPLRRLLHDPQAVVTGTILLIFIALGLAAPFIAPQDPNLATLQMVNAPIGTPGYLLGGDNSGRDILSRLLFSIPTALISGVIGVSVALAVGVTFGLIGGYGGRWAQGITEWIFALIMTFPGLLVLIILIPVTGGDYRVTMALFGVLLSPGVYRIVRNMVLGVKKELYVDAARVAGLSNTRILRKHILFVVRSPIIITAAFLSGGAIAIQSGLAFLGLGSPLIPSFGAMIGSAFTNLYRDPLPLVWPSILLGVLTSSLVLFGNSLRDALEGSRPKPVKQESRRVSTRREAAFVSGRDEALLVVEDLTIAYPTPTGELREVVSGVNLTLQAGQTIGLVGESGSGKTQTAFAVLGVLPAEAVIVKGSIRLEGRELLDLSEQEMRKLRGRGIAYVPQEPMSNLDPSYTVGHQLLEGIRASTKVPKREARERALALLERVGINDPARVFNSYPHQISGGMAQRVLIAGAVASQPRLLIADEPTTALDVTVQAEILDLLRDLQEELNMAVLLVTHNFGVVADICSTLAVMQQGRIVEAGQTRDVFTRPEHDYTKMLLDSILDETTVRSDPPALVASGKAES
jgi:peptide/nickel transport system permease protein